MVMSSSLAGAVMMTFFAPLSIWTGVAFGKAVNLPVAHLDFLTVNLCIQVAAAIDGIIFRKLEIGFGVKKVIDGHNFHLITVFFMQGAKYLASDAAKTIYANFHFAHGIFSSHL